MNSIPSAGHQGHALNATTAPAPVLQWLALALLPFTLTTAIAWKTKERCIEAVKMSSRPSITPPLAG